MQDDQNTSNSGDTSSTQATTNSNSPVSDFSSTPPLPAHEMPVESANTTDPTPENVQADSSVQSGSASDTNFTSQTSEAVTTAHTPQKYGGKKVIATIFGVLIIVGGIAAGAYLVQREQDVRKHAASGSDCDKSSDCELVDNATNSGSQTVGREITYIDITDKEFHRYYPGNSDDGCRRVNISGNTVSWDKYGDGPDCKDVSNVQIWMGGNLTPTKAEQPEFVKICHYTADTSAHPWQAIEISMQAWESGHDDAHDFKKTEKDYFYTNTDPNCPWPEPGNQGITCADLWCGEDIPPTTSPVPTNPPQNTANCSDVKAYDTSWNLLTQTELSNVSVGTTIRFSVSGSANSGTFDKARFSVNSDSLGETTLKKPGTDEFYIEYSVPDGIDNFNVSAQIHHSEFGWF